MNKLNSLIKELRELEIKPLDVSKDAQTLRNNINRAALAASVPLLLDVLERQAGAMKDARMMIECMSMQYDSVMGKRHKEWSCVVDIDQATKDIEALIKESEGNDGKA